MSVMACKFFQTNCCMKGSACPYRHELIVSQPAAVQPNPAETEKAKECFNFRKGTCKFGDKCKFLHSQPPSTSNPAPTTSRRKIPNKPDHHKRSTSAGKVSSGAGGKQPAGTKPKLPRAKFDDLLKHVSSYPGRRFERVPYRHKGLLYDVTNGKVRVKLADGRFAERNLPYGHAAVVCLQSVGLVSYPEGMRAVDISNHKLPVLCTAELDPLKPNGIAEISLPLQLGVTRYLMQGTSVILFKPYSDVHVGKEYYASVFVYRWNDRERSFVHALTWSPEGFHIVCASATSKYLAISRLPYNPAALEEAYQKEQLHQRTQQEIMNITQQLAALEQRMTQAEAARRAAEERQRQENARIEAQRRERADMYRRSDPMDFFVWDNEAKGYTRVLEYTKPVDDLCVSGKRLSVLIGDFTYVFDILIDPPRLHAYSWKQFRVEVERLTADC